MSAFAASSTEHIFTILKNSKICILHALFIASKVIEICNSYDICIIQ